MGDTHKWKLYNRDNDDNPLSSWGIFRRTRVVIPGPQVLQSDLFEVVKVTGRLLVEIGHFEAR
jgi:hypothetical protein